MFSQLLLLLSAVLQNVYVAETELISRSIIDPSKQSGDESLLENKKLIESLDPSGRIVLSWELGDNKSTITFELWAATVGYVGFGISPNGGMAGADIFIAGVSPDGTPYFSDRFASGNEEPKVDSHQDWNLLEAKENGTTTYLKFSRLVNTCDKDEDVPISSGTNRVIWAIGPTDELMKHSSMGDRGTRSIKFLHKRPTFNQTGLKSWIAGLSELAMPNDETTYWCSFHESFPLDTPKYLVAYEAYLPDKPSQDYVHHMVLYKCLLPEDGSFDKTVETLTVDNGYRGDLCTALKDKPIYTYCHIHPMLAIPKGGRVVPLPDNVAIKFEAKTGQKIYFLLETHMDNPEKSQGVLLKFGFKAFYTDKPRQYEASLTSVLYGNDGLLIPPNTRSFVYSGHCGSVCTEKLDPSGISIFNVQLHAHMFAKKLKFRHFRKDRELPWIAYDDNFDFNNQQPRVLDEERKVLPGDRLTIECEFDSTGSNGKVIVGGATSIDEMCRAIILYYPSNENFLGCWSNADEKHTLAPFNITGHNFTSEVRVKQRAGVDDLDEPAFLRGNLLDWLNHKFNWTKAFIEEFQARKRTEDQVAQCLLTRSGETKEAIFSHPEHVVEYVPEDTCN